VEEFKDLLRQSGLQAIEIVPCAVEAFMVREHPIVSRLWQSNLCREKFKKPVRKWFRSPPQWFRQRAGHTILTVSVPV